MDLSILHISFLFAAISSLFTIVNPFSTASIFLSIAKSNTNSEKKAMAKKAALTSAIVLITFAIIGNFILQFFSITINAFKIAGGILIFGVGYNMLNKKDGNEISEKEHKEATKKEDVSIIPLAIPMLSGPGAMTTSIVLMTETQRFLEQFYVIFAIIIVAVLSYIILSNAEKIFDRIGENGKNIIHKILGLIVVVVGIQFILNGIEGSIILWGLV